MPHSDHIHRTLGVGLVSAAFVLAPAALSLDTASASSGSTSSSSKSSKSSGKGGTGNGSGTKLTPGTANNGFGSKFSEMPYMTTGPSIPKNGANLNRGGKNTSRNNPRNIPSRIPSKPGRVEEVTLGLPNDAGGARGDLKVYDMATRQYKTLRADQVSLPNPRQGNRPQNVVRLTNQADHTVSYAEPTTGRFTGSDNLIPVSYQPLPVGPPTVAAY